MDDKHEQAVFGGGCFWCLDAIYRQLKGVESVVSGYSGGHTDNPTYDNMHGTGSGHAEVIQVTFAPSVISYQQLLELFFTFHDPTTLNRQGNDVGPEYRSIILYSSPEQQKIAQYVITSFVPKLWDDPVITEVKPLDKFWPAEDYHQDFFNKNPEQGYCQVVINPKVTKFRQKYAGLLKD